MDVNSSVPTQASTQEPFQQETKKRSRPH